VDRIEFFERLRKSHLLSESQWEQMACRFDGAGSSTNVAESLVAEGILTPFQICTLTSGDTQPLILGRYRLLDELGRGGMGRVYKALHTVMDRVVAVKVISPELIRDPLAVEWFRREVRACTQLAHPNIVMAYDADEAEGLHFLVMEYVHGITLDALVKQIGPLPIPYICALMCQAARGLQHAHDKAMVHRDIKPGNLLIPFSESEHLPEILVKILDFGLARLQGKTKGDTISLRGETGVLGTPDYIAPEQSRDIHSADIRSDLYSLGCAFYFALAGRVPFPGENAIEKLLKHLTEIADPLEKIRPDVPPEIAGLVRRLMAKDPAERPQTPAEVVKELDFWKAEPSSLDSGTSRPSCPPFLSPPTHHPAAKSNTVIQPAHTSYLDKIEVFAPSRREIEVSDFSCLPAAPANEFADKPKKRETHDTLSISRAEDTEAATAEALFGRGFPGHGERLETDATQLELPGEPSRDQTSTEPPPIDPEIQRLWQQWTNLVHTLIDRRGPSPIDAEVYRNVHTSLLQACRRAIDACVHPERRAFYEECLSIAQPWLKLQSFAVTDPIMLDSLLQRCRQIALELNNGISAWSSFQLYAAILTVINVLAGAVWYWKSGRLWLPVLLRIFDWNFSQSSLRVTWSFLQTHPSLLVGVVFPLVFVLAGVLWSRSART
jgi:serine/threonine protein kinase